MKIPFGKPLLGNEERLAVNAVLDSGILVHGHVADEFEKSFAQFVEAQHCVSVSSCTSGMHLVYYSLGLGPGDEVIVPAQTHVATAHAVELTGAKAVFVDACPDTGNIHVSNIEAHISSRTRAIAVVHYLGVPVDMNAVMAIAQKHSLFVLEDCALAHGTKIDDVHAGLHGDVGVFSFYPVKHMTTGEGGIVISKHKDLINKIRHLRAFGVDRAHGERAVPGWYDATALGFNYRMSELHAAIGVEQVKKLPDFLDARKRNWVRLNKLLSKSSAVRVLPQPHGPGIKSSFYCLGALLSEEIVHLRADIMLQLKNKGVGSSIYYPQPVPRMKFYADKYGYNPNEFPGAELISNAIIALPVGPHLGLSEMDEIAATLETVVEEMDV